MYRWKNTLGDVAGRSAEPESIDSEHFTLSMTAKRKAWGNPCLMIIRC
ncbi:hypothetical protein LJK88_26460 [Paenibacillus sp. P26]|nr:hypothetical protein LJK88_26460 [Paenibacillus sp. P26]UUZ95069.1 hypothetical protein LJK87_11510 [Paenibacillus sp. P25]